MDLDSISNEYKKNLDNFFNNEEVIRLIYEEQYGTDYYKNNANECKKKFKEIMENTVFVPYITMDHLDKFLILARDSFGRKYLSQNYRKELEFLDKNSEKIKKLEKNSSVLSKEEIAFLDHAKKLESYLISIRNKIGNEYINQNYKDELSLLRNLQGTKKNIVKKYTAYMLDELKKSYPQLNKDEFNKILKKCPNLNIESNAIIIRKLLKDSISANNQTNILKKSKQDKIDKCIKKYQKLVKDKILMEPGKGKIIIKEYSSYMLDELKDFYPELQQSEYDKVLKKCSNLSFKENASLIQEFLQNSVIPKNNKNGLFKKLKENKINNKTEKILDECIKKYTKLANDKILMETSTYFKHTSDVSKDKYYTSMLEGMNKDYSTVFQQIGRDSNKNVRYIFLPVLKYNNLTNYLTRVTHEVMHISKESIQKDKYKTGLLTMSIDKNHRASRLTHIPFPHRLKYQKWSHFAKKHNLPVSKQKVSFLTRNYIT